MPPEMITIVAPTAITAKKLASVAIWISVCELRKLFTVRPSAPTWLPAMSVSSVPRTRITSTSPACWAASSLRSTIGVAARRAGAQARRGGLGREVALRLGGELVAHEELAHAGRAQQRREEHRVQPRVAVLGPVAGPALPAHRVRE